MKASHYILTLLVVWLLLSYFFVDDIWVYSDRSMSGELEPEFQLNKAFSYVLIFIITFIIHGLIWLIILLLNLTYRYFTTTQLKNDK